MPTSLMAWSPPQAIDTTSPAAQRFDTSVAMATGASNTVRTVWRSNGVLDTDPGLRTAASSDGGITWSPAATIPGTATDPDQYDDVAAVGAAGDGTWVIAWSTMLPGGDFEIAVIRSTDNGENWSAPALVSAGSPAIAARHYLPTVETDGSGTWLIAWDCVDTTTTAIGKDGDLLFSRSIDNGQNWSAPAILNTDAAPDNRSDTGVQLTGNGSGTWIACWSALAATDEGYGKDWEVFYAVTTNNGVSWGAPKPITTFAQSDVGGDMAPDIATDGNGNWMAAWPSTNTPAGTAGAETDLLMATSQDNGTTWTAPVYLNAATAGSDGNDGEPTLKCSNGNFVAVWPQATPANTLALTWSWLPAANPIWTTPQRVDAASAGDGLSDAHADLAFAAGDMQVAAWAVGAQYDTAVMVATQMPTSAANDWELFE